MIARAAVLAAALLFVLGAAAGAQDDALLPNLDNLFQFPRPTPRPVSPAAQEAPQPLWGTHDTGTEREQSLGRPFYTRRTSADGEFERTQFLWPIWLYQRAGEQRRIHLLPVYYYQRDVHRYGDMVDDERDWALFPLLWGGSSTRDGDYLALFPVAGTLKGLLAKDEIRFVAFPVWFQWRVNDHVSTSWFWPIYTHGTGGGKETRRLWPLYGYTTKEGHYDRRFYAWPFIYREDFDLGTARPGYRSMTWPFWTMEDSTLRDYRSVLWPFFSVEENHRHQYREVAAPWPFFVRATGARDRFQVWPLFTGTRREGRETHRFAGPIGSYTKDTSEAGVTRSELSVAMILREERIVWEETGERYQFSRVWPFFDYETWPDGASRTNVLSFLPFRDRRGFEYQYAPAYTVYHHERRPDGSRLSWAFWNLYRHERTAEREEWRLGPGLHYASDLRAGTSEFQLLGGLLGMRRDGRARSLQLGWVADIPLGRRPRPATPEATVYAAIPETVGQ